MAAFNPAPPDTQDPVYLNWSKPISDIPANQSSAIALKTLGTGIEGVAELADSTVKNIIKSDTYKAVDPLRDAYTASLEAINNPAAAVPGAKDNPVNLNPMWAQNTYGYVAGQPQSTQGPQNLMPDASADVPAGLQNGLDKASVIAQAQKQGGHYNDTAYSAQLTAVAKQMRAQYPGYRPYIDQQISEASGVPIANSLVKNLMEDANRQATNNKSETEKIQAFIRSNADLPGAADIYASYQQNGNSNLVMQWASSNLAIKHNLEMKKLKQETTSGDKKVDMDNVTDYANSVASENATKFFSNKRFAPGDKSPSQIADAITFTHLHPDTANEASIQILGQQYEAYRTQAINETMAALTTPGKDGKSVMQKLGPDATKNIVDKSVGALFDSTSNLIYSKDFGAAHMVQNQSDAVIHNAGMGILNSSIGQETANIAWITQKAPQAAPILFSGMAVSGYQSDLQAFTTSQKNKGLAQPDMLRGKPYTFNESVDQLGTYAGQKGTAVPGDAYKSLTDLTQAITNPKSTDPLRVNAFTYFFDPKNMDVMSKFPEGYYDPVQKRMVQGREAAFSALTSKDVTDAAVKMRDGGHLDIWNNYKNWATHEAANHLIPNDVANLNDAIKYSGGDGLNYSGDAGTQSRYHFGWDTDSHHLVLTNADGSPLQGMQATTLNLPYRSVQNINQTLDHLQNIAKAEGTGNSVDAFMYKTIASAAPGGAQSLIMQALRTAYTDTSGKVSKFAEEDKGPSVSDFLANPTGTFSNGKRVIKGNLSDEQMVGIDTQSIPVGMSARDFIKQLQSQRK